MVSNISFCIPSKNNLRYVKVAIKYLRENCVNKNHEILIWVDGDDDNTSEYLSNLNDPYIKYWVNQNEEPFGIGNAYDFLVEKSSNDLVMMYHTDMIASPNFDEEILKYHKRGVVVTATRIEPPLHPPEPCKIVENFGLWPEEDVKDGFLREEFYKKINEYKLSYGEKITPGVFAPWLIHKDDYNSVHGHDPLLNSLAEDNDIFNRLSLSGITFIQTWNAFVYHLTCRGGQFEHAETTDQLSNKSEKWQLLSYRKTREFIRKWGFPPMSGPLKEPIVWPLVSVHANIKNLKNINLLRYIEPMFVSISTDNQSLVDQYILEEQPHTEFDLSKKFKDVSAGTVDISFDMSYISNSHINKFLSKLPIVLEQVKEVGEYEFDIFTINVKSLDNETIRIQKPRSYPTD